MMHVLRFASFAALAAPAAAQELPVQHPHQNACGVMMVSGVGPDCPTGFAPIPTGWHAGDTHEHIQQCFAASDVPPPAIYQEMLTTELRVSNPLIWGAGFITPDQFRSYLTQYVTGAEHPTTAGDPERVIWCGIETSGVSAGSLGHMIGLRITPEAADIFQLGLGCAPLWPAPGWKNDGSGDYSKPVLDRLRQSEGAVTGYAHQSWPVDLYADVSAGGWDWESPAMPAYVGADARCSFGRDMAFPLPKTCGNTHPVLAPFDVALGRIDFLEAFELLQPTCGGPLEKRYFGLYYKLLNAGQRVALTAGTDADCIGLACPPRAYVKIKPGQSFSYDTWTQALAEGRTSLAVGPHQFLELRVDNRDPGETVSVSKPSAGTATVQVKATYRLGITDGTTVSDAIEIVQDGEVVASMPFGPITSGQKTFHVDVPITRSGWIAARTATFGTHSAAVYVRYEGQPTASCADAEYWTIYADFIDWILDVAATTGPEALQFYAGCSEPEIRDYLQKGRRIFAAIRDYDAPAPPGIERFGQATPPACAEPSALVASGAPVAGQPFDLRWFNAPADAFGGLVLSSTPLPLGLSLMGARIHVLPIPALVPVLIGADEGGFGQLHVPQLPAVAGTTAYVQAVWVNPPGCDPAAILSSSDALAVTIQP